jgi:hypothetical protein
MKGSNKKNDSSDQITRDNLDQVLFDDTKFSDLLKDIYSNVKSKEEQIKSLVGDLRPLITNVGEATMIVPLIKEYMDVGVKNDEQLVKVAGVVQRLLASTNSTVVAKEKITTTKNDTKGDDFFGLSDEEKSQIMKDIKEVQSAVK